MIFLSKKAFVIVCFLATLTALFAEEFEHFSKPLNEGDEIILKGSFCTWNGFPPNIRFITAENKLIGIGKDENYHNKKVEEILAVQRKSNVLYETEVTLQYIGEVFYYDKPLMCFAVIKIKISE